MFRRKFLKTVGLGVGAVTLPSLGAYAVPLNDATAGVIRHQFRFLRLDEQGVARFVRDYYQEQKNNSLMIQLKMKLYYLFRVDAEQSQLVRSLTTLYLLSTDFFQNKMDESKLVQYQGIYDLYKTPCGHPFSALRYPPAA